MVELQPQPLFHAFVSYSHADEQGLALAIHKALHKFNKPLWRIRALRIFLDDSSLSANPALKESIRRALSDAQYLILLASPAAAASPWVAWELDYWCRHKDIARIIIVLASGDIRWNPAQHDFEWTKTSALPRRLSGEFQNEPRWVDMRRAAAVRPLDLTRPEFRACIAEIAAPLHGKPKDALIGEDLRESQRLLNFTRGVFSIIGLFAIGLAMLAIALQGQKNTAVGQRDNALRNQSLYLANLAHQRIDAGDTEQGMLLALEALPDDSQEQPSRPYTPEAEAALFAATLAPRAPRKVAVLQGVDTQERFEYATFSPDGKLLAITFTQNSGYSVNIYSAANGELLRVLRGHDGSISYVEFSPDSRQLITASMDRSARLWDVASGEQLGLFAGHDKGVSHAAFGPGGRILATASFDGSARLWDIASGTLLNTFTREGHSLQRVLFNPRGDRLLTLSMAQDIRQGGSAQLWNPNNGKEIAEFGGIGFEYAIPMVSVIPTLFSPDGKWVLTVKRDASIHLWDATDGHHVSRLNGHEAGVRHAEFSSDGRLLITASRDGTARIWQLQQDMYGRIPSGSSRILRPEGDPFSLPHPNPQVKSVAITPDQRYIVTSGTNGSRLWNTHSGRQIAVLMSQLDQSFVAVSPAGDRLITLGERKAVLWEMPQNEVIFQLHHSAPITAVTISADARLIATAGNDGRILLWNAQNGIMLHAIETSAKEIGSITFNSTGTRLLSLSLDYQGQIWSIPDAKLVHNLISTQNQLQPATRKPDWDSARILTNSVVGVVTLWDEDTGSEIARFGNPKDPVVSSRFSPDGSRLLTLTHGGVIGIYDTSSTALLSRIKGPAFGARMAIFSPDGNQIAVSKDSGSGAVRESHWSPDNDSVFVVSIWNLATGTRQAELKGHYGTIFRITFDADGKRILTTSSDGTARLWDIHGKPGPILVEPCMITPTPISLLKAEFSSGGARITTTYANGKSILWDTASGTLLAILHSRPYARISDACTGSVDPVYSEVQSVAYSTDGRLVVSGGRDGIARVIRIVPTLRELSRLAKEVVTRTLTADERKRFFLEPATQVQATGSDKKH